MQDFVSREFQSWDLTRASQAFTLFHGRISLLCFTSQNYLIRLTHG